MSIRMAHGPPLLGTSARKGFPPKAYKSIVRAMLVTLGVWILRSGERRALRGLAQDSRLLNDIGITREQAMREAAKPFWRR
jgi:uncharacterized protein YjiS (DUF1127 family)